MIIVVVQLLMSIGMSGFRKQEEQSAQRIVNSSSENNVEFERSTNSQKDKHSSDIG